MALSISIPGRSGYATASQREKDSETEQCVALEHSYFYRNARPLGEVSRGKAGHENVARFKGHSRLSVWNVFLVRTPCDFFLEGFSRYWPPLKTGEYVSELGGCIPPLRRSFQEVLNHRFLPVQQIGL